MSQKVSFKFEEQFAPGDWRVHEVIDSFIIETDVQSLDKLKPLVQEQIDLLWNDQLKKHEKRRRVFEVVRSEKYVDPRRGDFDEKLWDVDEDMIDDDYNDDEEDEDDYMF